MSCWFPFDKYTCQLLPNWLFHSLTPHTSAPFTRYYCIHSSFHKQLPDKVEKGKYWGINAVLGGSWCGLVTRCWGCAERSVSVMASLIKLGTIACHMCAMLPTSRLCSAPSLPPWPACADELGEVKPRGPCGKVWKAARPWSAFLIIIIILVVLLALLWWGIFAWKRVLCLLILSFFQLPHTAFSQVGALCNRIRSGGRIIRTSQVYNQLGSKAPTVSSFYTFWL